MPVLVFSHVYPRPVEADVYYIRGSLKCVDSICLMNDFCNAFAFVVG
jgi:hypothetical protein